MHQWCTFDNIYTMIDPNFTQVALQALQSVFWIVVTPEIDLVRVDGPQVALEVLLQGQGNKARRKSMGRPDFHADLGLHRTHQTVQHPTRIGQSRGYAAPMNLPPMPRHIQFMLEESEQGSHEGDGTEELSCGLNCGLPASSMK